MNHLTAICLTVLTWASAQCGSTARAFDGEPVPLSMPSPHVHKGKPFSDVWFVNDFEAARADAEHAKRPLLLFLSAAWCEPCKILHSEVLSSPDLHSLMSNFTLLAADIESEAAQDIYRRYRTAVWPTCIVVNPFDEAALETVGGFKPRDEIQAFLGRGKKKFEAFLKNPGGALDGPFIEIRKGRAAQSSMSFNEAAQRFERARMALTAGTAVYSSVLQLEAESLMDAGRFDACARLSMTGIARVSAVAPFLFQGASCATKVNQTLRDEFYKVAKPLLEVMVQRPETSLCEEDTSHAFRILEDWAKEQQDEAQLASLLREHFAFLETIPVPRTSKPGLSSLEEDRIFVYKTQGRIDALIESYVEFEDKNPNDGRVRYYLAGAAFEAGNFLSAANHADLAFQQLEDPMRLEVMWLLVDIFNALNDKEKESDVRRTMAAYIEQLPAAMFTVSELRHTRDILRTGEERDGEE